MTIKEFFHPKKRLIPLFVVCWAMLFALLYVFIFNFNAINTVFWIFVPLVIAALMLTSYLSKDKIDSLYLMMNNAYLRYQQDVASGKIEYDDYCENFLAENDPSLKNYQAYKEDREHTDKVNRLMTYRLLANHRETVEKAFAEKYTEKELPLSVFNLLKGLALKKEPIIETPINADENNPQKAPVGENVSTEGNVSISIDNNDIKVQPKNDNPFKSKLTDYDLEDFLEEIKYGQILSTPGTKELCLDDIKDFFHGISKPTSESLILDKPKLFCYLMKKLQESHFICIKWQSVIYKRNLLASQDGKYVDQSQLSTGVYDSTHNKTNGADSIDSFIVSLMKRHEED